MKKPLKVAIAHIAIRRFMPTPQHTWQTLDPNSQAMFLAIAEDIINELPKEGYRIIESILQ